MTQKDAIRQDATNETPSVVVVVVSFMCRGIYIGLGRVWCITAVNTTKEKNGEVDRERQKERTKEMKRNTAKKKNKLLVLVHTTEGKHRQHSFPALCVA